MENDKISAGAKFIAFIAKMKKKREIYIQEHEDNLEINENSVLFKNEKYEDLGIEINKALYEEINKENLILKRLIIHEPIESNDFKKKYTFLSQYEPIQVSACKNSLAVLLKSKKIINVKLNNFTEYQRLFENINMNLKNKKQTYQSFFLNNFHNQTLTLDDKYLFFYEEKEGHSTDEIIKDYWIHMSEFKVKINELLGERNHKILTSLFTSLQKERIIDSNRINLLTFYQLLKSINSIYTTKLIILGDFAAEWYNKFKSSYKRLSSQWEKIFTKTLSFELPTVLLPLKNVKIGNNHLIMLTTEGEVYSLGDGRKGATGNNNPNFTCKPTKVEFPFPNTIIEKIAAGSRHNLVLDTGTTLYSWGCGACGCLGNDSLEDAYVPIQISLPTACDAILEIDAADNYSGCLTSEGNLYTWGNSQFNRLGLSKEINTKIPQLVSGVFAKSVTHFKCGYLTTLVQMNDNNIYGLGVQTLSDYNVNKEENQPQKETKNYASNSSISDKISKNSKITSKKNLKKNEEIIPNVEKTEGKLFSFKVNIKETKKNLENLGMFIGERFYCIALKYNPILSKDKKEEKKDDNSILLLKGGDFNGLSNINISLNNLLPNIKSGTQKILLEGISESIADLKKTENNSGKKEKKIKKIICSENNTGILTNTGEVYIFGSSLYQVAPVKIEDCYIPIQPHGTKILHLALGANHILMVTSNKEVYVAGRNTEGQLGLGYTSNSVDIITACQIEPLIHQGARKCYAAENYSIVITMGAKSCLWAFGDIPFLQSSSHISKQLAPKMMNWGEVEKVACGPNHILLLEKELNLYKIKAVGNGMYGKLGNSDPYGTKHHSPVEVDLPYYEIKNTKDVKLRCGPTTSGVLIKDDSTKDEQNSKYKLYMWGLCCRKLFHRVKELEKKHKFEEITYSSDSMIPVITPIHISEYNVQDLAIGEEICYFITSGKNELEKIGERDFRGRKNNNHEIIAYRFQKIAININHAAALSMKGKLFTWGSNVMNKLCFSNKEVKSSTQFNGKDTTISEDTDLEKFFIETPSNVVKFNEIFEQQENAQNDEEILKLMNEEQLETPEMLEKIDDGDINITENNKKEEEDIPSLTIYAKARDVIKTVKPRFEELQKKLEIQESAVNKKLKDILGKYRLLKDQGNQSLLKEESIENLFYFKFTESPFKIQFRDKEANLNKYPKKPLEYKENFIALLSVLHTHPCYFIKIYKNKLFDNNELYKIIKDIFKGIQNDRFSQLILITLCKEILLFDIKEQNITSLEKFKIMTFEEGREKYTSLFGRLCKLIFKIDSKYKYRQEIAVSSIVAQVFSLMESPSDCGEELLLKIHPEDVSVKPKPDLNNYQRTDRIKKIMNIFDFFNNELLNKSNMDKNNLFSVKSIAGSQPIFSLPEICLMLIKEIVKVLKIITSDEEKIYDWIGKKFASMIFSHFLKVLENPRKKLAIASSMLIDPHIYSSFINCSKDNFYSIAYVFRFCLNYFSLEDQIQDEEINKEILKLYKNTNTSVLINIKNILINEPIESSHIEQPNDAAPLPSSKSTLSKSFEFEYLKEFFYHSLNDSKYVINFSFYYLRRLLEVLIENRKKIAVLNEKYDMLEQVFSYGKLEENKDVLKAFGIDNDITYQFELKTKSLCLKKALFLTRCAECKSILLKDHILGKEISFFDEFNFINPSSSCGKYITLLKMLDPINVKNDEFNKFLKGQFEKKKENFEFKELLSQLLSLIAIDAKDELQLNEETISKPDKLIETMLESKMTNVKLKKYSEEIVKNYDKMKEHMKYLQSLSNIITEIGMEIDKKAIEKNHFLVDIYDELALRVKKGFGNVEMKKMDKKLPFTSMLMKVLRKNDSLPKSETIYKTLPKEKRDSMKVERDFWLKKMIEDSVIINIYKFKKEINEAPDNYKITISQLKNFEFMMDLIRSEKAKESIFACGKIKGNSLNQKLISMKIDSLLLSEIIKKATKKEKKKEKKRKIIKLGDFIDVNPEKFIHLLKKLFDIGSYSD